MPATHSLSIIIPTHHRPNLLIRAVGSALSSCAASDEVLVVADRDPGARTVLARWTDDPRVKVLDNTGQGGASDTRNLGVAAATGDTVLFLDDDDALVPGYAERVRAITTATWGFGSQIIRQDGDENTALTPRPDLKGGVAGEWVPFRRKIAALGAGLWVRRSLFNAVGGLSCDQRIDEDTDLCCRLLAAGHQPWIEPHPAMIIDRLVETPRLTSSTDAETRAICYLRTFQRNIASLKHERGAAAFLAFRAQRMILRSKRHDLLEHLYKDVPGFHLKALLRAKHLVKRVKV